MPNAEKYKDLRPADCPLVRVEWRDIIMDDAWDDSNPDLDTPEGFIIGHLLENGPRDIVIASGYNYTEDCWCTFHVFPATVPEIIQLLPVPELIEEEEPPSD